MIDNRQGRARAAIVVARKPLVGAIVSLVAVLVAGLALAWHGSAKAQSADAAYPTRSIRLVVPFTPGGGSDAIARLIGQKLGESLKQGVVIDNKPGAGGSIGTKEAQRANPDGYTLLLATSSTHGINPWIYSNIGYDPLKDFAPITMLATTDYGLAVPVASSYKSMADLLQAGKSGKVDYASSGNGTTSHLAGALLTSMSKTPFNHVPYKSSGPAQTDLQGGQVAFMFDNTSVMLPHAKSGRLRLLATSGATRSAAAKDIPTIAESGVPGFEIIGWFCLLAPAGTPPAIINLLNREVTRIVALPDVREKLLAGGNEPLTLSPDDTRKYMAGQLAKYKTVVELSGAKAD